METALKLIWVQGRRIQFQHRESDRFEKKKKSLSSLCTETFVWDKYPSCMWLYIAEGFYFHKFHQSKQEFDVDSSFLGERRTWPLPLPTSALSILVCYVKWVYLIHCYFGTLYKRRSSLKQISSLISLIIHKLFWLPGWRVVCKKKNMWPSQKISVSAWSPEKWCYWNSVVPQNDD